MKKIKLISHRLLSIFLITLSIVFSFSINYVTASAVAPAPTIGSEEVMGSILEYILTQLGLVGSVTGRDSDIRQDALEHLEAMERLIATDPNYQVDFERKLSEATASIQAYNHDHTLNPYLNFLNRATYSRSGIAGTWGLENILRNASDYYETNGNSGLLSDIRSAIDFVRNPQEGTNIASRLMGLEMIVAVSLTQGDSLADLILKTSEGEFDESLVVDDTEFTGYDFTTAEGTASGLTGFLDANITPHIYTSVDPSIDVCNGWVPISAIYINQAGWWEAWYINPYGEFTKHSEPGFNFNTWTIIQSNVPVVKYPADILAAYQNGDIGVIDNIGTKGLNAFIDEVVPESDVLDDSFAGFPALNPSLSDLLDLTNLMSRTLPQYIGREAVIPAIRDLFGDISTPITDNTNILRQILTGVRDLLVPVNAIRTWSDSLVDIFPAIRADVRELVDVFPTVTAELGELVDTVPAALAGIGSAIIDIPGQITLPLVGYLEGIATDLTAVRAKVDTLNPGDPNPSPTPDPSPTPEPSNPGVMNPVVNNPWLDVLWIILLLIWILLVCLGIFMNLLTYVINIFNIPPSTEFINDDILSAIMYLKNFKLTPLNISVYDFLFGLVYIVMFFSLIKLLQTIIRKIRVPH